MEPIIAPNLKLLFIGLNPAVTSYENGVYFSSRRKFWELLHESGLTTETIVGRNWQRGDDKRLLSYGMGITDLIHTPSDQFRRHDFTLDERKRLADEIAYANPRILAFLGKKAYATYTGMAPLDYGWQTPNPEGRLVFVLPFPTTTPIPHAQRVSLYRELAKSLVS